MKLLLDTGKDPDKETIFDTGKDLDSKDNLSRSSSKGWKWTRMFSREDF